MKVRILDNIYDHQGGTVWAGMVCEATIEGVCYVVDMPVGTPGAEEGGEWPFLPSEVEVVEDDA